MQRPVLALVTAAAFLFFAGPAYAAETWAWLAYGHDTELTNDVPSTSITAESVRDLGQWWTARLDGAVVASPLSARVVVHGRGRQLLYVSTEAGSVYALLAGTGEVVWKRDFDTVATAGCGSFGFSSTGAIDLDRRVLYEAGADGLLHALDLATGAERAPWPLRVIDRVDYEYVWGGLQLIGGRVYVLVASHCDEADPTGASADGRLVIVDPAAVEQIGGFDPVPGYGNLGGIWGWGGVSADLDGKVIYTAVGNSRVYSNACACVVDNAGYGNSIVALTPDLSQVLGSDQPAGVPTMGDDDFGAAPLLFQPRGCPPLAAAKNKVGALYVWDRTHLSDGPIARFELGDASSAFVGAPSYDPVRGTFFVSKAVVGGDKPGYGIVAFRAGPECSLHPIWTSEIGSGNQPAPLVVGDVVLASRGRLGGFGALSAVNGHQLWSFPTDAQTISPVIEVGGMVVGGDLAGNLYAFRINASPRFRPR
jgi:outer membrane protein assembly factor BamB